MYTDKAQSSSLEFLFSGLANEITLKTKFLKCFSYSYRVSIKNSLP